MKTLICFKDNLATSLMNFMALARPIRGETSKEDCADVVLGPEALYSQYQYNENLLEKNENRREPAKHLNSLYPFKLLVAELDGVSLYKITAPEPL